MGAHPPSSALCSAPISVPPARFGHLSSEPSEPLAPSVYQSSRLSLTSRFSLLPASWLGWCLTLEEKQADPGARLPIGTIEKGLKNFPVRRMDLLILENLFCCFTGDCKRGLRPSLPDK